MAAVAEQESETQLCGNCQKDIPLANFTMHEIHCSRNIGVCHICKESFPKAEMKSHQELEHTQVTCKCSMKMDRGLLQEHMALECPLRRVTCQHCDLELAFNQLQEHEDYCGARTERCTRCNRNVMLKDLKEHPEDCSKRAEEARVAQTKPGLNSGALLRDFQAIRSLLQAGDALPRMNRRLESDRLYFSGEWQPKEPNRRSITPAQPAQNPGSLEKVSNTQAFIGQEPDSDLDYMLAVSLQREHGSREHSAAQIQRELWEDFCPNRTKLVVESDSSAAQNCNSPFISQGFSTNTPNKPKVETMLPCEFCEELFPEEDLILHQTGCNPASALASFSKMSAPISRHNRDESLMDLWEQLQGSRSASYRDTHPLQPGVGSSLMLPCEFCGVQLEEEVIFHHQDQCDLRPATASTGRPQVQQGTPESVERPEALVLPRRRTQHQGDASPQYLEEEFRQERPPLSSRGTLIRESPVTIDRIPLSSPVSRRENSVGLSEQAKLKERGSSGGRGPWGTNSPPAAATSLPARHSPLAFIPSSYVPSFPVTAPTRPSMRNEGQRITQSTPGNSTQARPWQDELEYPGQE